MTREAGARELLIAESPAMKRVVAQIEKFADVEAPALISGEAGTGREMIARVLHQMGPRRTQRFIAVRADGEIPGLYSTGAAATSSTTLRSAHGGTLLIKDVCDLPARAHRVLRKVIGGAGGKASEAPDGVDVRVIATCDGVVEQAVAAERFPRDVFETLSARRIKVPALRQRREDIPLLAEVWLRHYGRELGRARIRVSTRAYERMIAYPWPGNVGELRAFCRRLVVAVESGKIGLDDVETALPTHIERLPAEGLSFDDVVRSKITELLAKMGDYDVGDLYQQVMDHVEKPLLELALAHTGGNQVRAAEMLGLNRATLRRKLKK